MGRRILFATLALAACLIVYGVGEAYQAMAVSNGGAITGEVKLAGTPPKVEMLPITKNKDYCGESTPAPTHVISQTGAIKNVLVTLEGIQKGKEAQPVKDAELDNTKCVFKPHVQAVTVGTTLAVVNTDPILHNTHVYLEGKKTAFNLALPTQGQKIQKPLTRPGLMSAKCDAGHTWMSAYIYVSETPYYFLTGEDGKFKISDIPPGTYKLKAWHEALGTLEKDVTVTEKGEIKVDFSFKKE